MSAFDFTDMERLKETDKLNFRKLHGLKMNQYIFSPAAESPFVVFNLFVPSIAWCCGVFLDMVTRGKFLVKVVVSECLYSLSLVAVEKLRFI